MKYLLLFLIALSVNGCAYSGYYNQSRGYSDYDRSSYSELGLKPRYYNAPVYYVQQPQVIYVERYQPRNNDYYRMERDRYQNGYYRRHR